MKPIRDELKEIICPECSLYKYCLTPEFFDKCHRLTALIALFTGRVTGERLLHLIKYDGPNVVDVKATAKAINEKLGGG